VVGLHASTARFSGTPAVTGLRGWVVLKAKFHVVVKRVTPVTALGRTPCCISAPQKTPRPYYKDQAVNFI